MQINTLTTILLATLILTSCAPTATVQMPTKTVVTAPTSILVPTTSTATKLPPIPTPQNLTPTPAPTVPLSANGPWLLYVHNTPRTQVMDVTGAPAEFIILNQDGSGRTSILMPDCGQNAMDQFMIDGQNSASYRAKYHGSSYLFRPAQTTGMRVTGYDLWYPACDTFSNGDEKNELVASIYRAEDNDIPELLIYELPSGKIRDRIPLVKCAKDATACEKNRVGWHNMEEQKPDWSPNGRYLAFSAVIDSAASDLFLYDAKDGHLRRLTNGPDWVGAIEWSPDGTQIIMHEIANHADGYFPRPSIVGDPSSSLWSVSVSNNETKLLYNTYGRNQNILQWLDDKRFFAYTGALVNADQASNLRLVDTSTGTDRILFDGDFIMYSFDPIHQTFALVVIDTDKYPDRYYLVSVKDSTYRPFARWMDFPRWDAESGLFVSDDACEKEPQSLQAVDYLGNAQCVPKSQPTPTPTALQSLHYPAPDGKSVVSLKDGIWLEAQGQVAVQISAETAAEVIWCPNSDCFFFFAPQQDHKWKLYHVSVPTLTLKMVDEGIESTTGVQWLGNDQ